MSKTKNIRLTFLLLFWFFFLCFSDIEIELRTSCMLGKHSITEQSVQPSDPLPGMQQLRGFS